MNAEEAYNAAIALEGAAPQQRNPREAFRLFKLAADGGHPEAIFKLGKYHFYGYGTAKNEAEALRYLSIAAEKNGEAAVLCGRLYEYGKTIPRDKTKAVDYYWKAADLNNREAYFRLAAKYEKGVDVQRDSLEGKRLFALATRDGTPEAIYQGAIYMISGCGLKIDMKTSYAWLSRAEELGHLQAKVVRGLFLLYGLFGNKNAQEAFNLFREATEKGCHYGTLALAMCYTLGRAVDVDYKQGLRLATVAIEAGYVEGNYYAGICLKHLGVLDESYMNLKIASDNGFPLATRQLYYWINNDTFIVTCADGGLSFMELATEQVRTLRSQFPIGLVSTFRDFEPE